MISSFYVLFFLFLIIIICIDFIGSDLKKLWIHLKNRYQSEVAKFKRLTPSGSAAQSTKKWIYFDSMRFLDQYSQPREIKSSIQLKKSLNAQNNEDKNDTDMITPQEDEFCKRKRSQKYALDEEFLQASKLMRLELENLKKENESPKCTETNNISYGKKNNVVCNVLLEQFRDMNVSNSDRFNCFCMIINEIKKLKESEEAEETILIN